MFHWKKCLKEEIKQNNLTLYICKMSIEITHSTYLLWALTKNYSVLGFNKVLRTTSQCFELTLEVNVYDGLQVF